MYSKRCLFPLKSCTVLCPHRNTLDNYSPPVDSAKPRAVAAVSWPNRGPGQQIAAACQPRGRHPAVLIQTYCGLHPCHARTQRRHLTAHISFTTLEQHHTTQVLREERKGMESSSSRPVQGSSMKVLVAVDDSDGSRHALTWVLDHLVPADGAEQPRPTLVLVHAHEPLHHVMYPVGPGDPVSIRPFACATRLAAGTCLCS
jgi:hypothetical protein